MKFTYACCTDTGRRSRNEDAYGLEQGSETLMAMVADGVGGSDNGQIASRMAVDTVLRDTREQEPDEDTLLYALIRASGKIFREHIGGYTTAAVLWLWNGGALAAHVGDSRIYQFRDGRIQFQSVDHSSVQMAVLMGQLDANATRTHPDRNKIYRALGMEEPPKADSTELTVRPGDRFLICSDGFWEPVLEEAMLDTLRQTNTPEQWLRAMQDIVIAARDPRQDNYTAICIQVE